MKKSLLFLFLIGIFSSGFSQWQNNNDRGQNNNGQYNYSQNSALIVSANTQNSFTVMVDNSYQYQSNGNNGYGNTVNVGSCERL